MRKIVTTDQSVRLKVVRGGNVVIAQWSGRWKVCEFIRTTFVKSSSVEFQRVGRTIIIKSKMLLFPIH